MIGVYNEVVGDVTEPHSASNNKVIVIPHVCNNVGAFGAGVALSIAKRWPHVQQKFFDFSKRFPNTDRELLMGMVLFVAAEKTACSTIHIANMFAQRGLRSSENKHPLEYTALTRAMADVVDTCNEMFGRDGFEIHCPKFGTALAGGTWKKIRPIIDSLWLGYGIDVTVYNFGG